MNRRSARAAVLLVALLLPVAPCGAAAATPRYRVEAGAGLYVPFGEENRDDFGTGGALHLGLAANPGWKTTWLVLEADIVRSSGRDAFDDGTFEPPDSEYTVVPVAFGVRTMAGSIDEDAPVRLYVGAAFLTVFTSYELPFTEPSRTPTFGAMVELRPEVSLGPRAGLYFRQRVMVMLDAEYDAFFRALNYSGTTLDLGLVWRVR